MVVFLAAQLCSGADPLTATVDAVATQHATVGSPVELVIKVTNTGPPISQLGLVFRTADRCYERHKVTDLGGCTIATDVSAFACGGLARSETKTFAFRGVANAAGSFHSSSRSASSCTHSIT
jgi:hypothetical protein